MQQPMEVSPAPVPEQTSPGTGKSKRIQRLHRWHAWSGLIFGANLILFSFTGAVLVFYAELNPYVGPRPPAALADAEPAVASLETRRALQPTIDQILAGHPAARVAHLRLAPPESAGAHSHSAFDRYHRLDLDVPLPENENASAGESEHLQIYIEPGSGRFAAAEDQADPLRWIFQLHATFFAGSIGKTLLGVVAIALLVSSVTGLLLYGPFSKGQSLRAPATLIRGTAGNHSSASRRLFFADWHKLIGIISLAFQLLMAGTGLLLTVGTLVIQIYTYVLITGLREAPSPRGATATEFISVDDVIARSREIFSGDRYIKTILFPGEVQGPDHFAVLAYGSGTFGQYIPELAMFHAPQNRADAPPILIELPWFIKLIAAAAPLHFGNFGGLPVKILYCLFGLTSGALAITGYVMYAIKYRRRSRAQAGSP